MVDAVLVLGLFAAFFGHDRRSSRVFESSADGGGESCGGRGGNDAAGLPVANDFRNAADLCSDDGSFGGEGLHADLWDPLVFHRGNEQQIEGTKNIRDVLAVTGELKLDFVREPGGFFPDGALHRAGTGNDVAGAEAGGV